MAEAAACDDRAKQARQVQARVLLRRRSRPVEAVYALFTLSMTCEIAPCRLGATIFAKSRLSIRRQIAPCAKATKTSVGSRAFVLLHGRSCLQGTRACGCVFHVPPHPQVLLLRSLHAKLHHAPGKHQKTRFVQHSSCTSSCLLGCVSAGHLVFLSDRVRSKSAVNCTRLQQGLLLARVRRFFAV